MASNDLTVVWNPAWERIVRDDPRVVAELARTARLAEKSMQAHAPVAPPAPGENPGELRRSISSDRTPDGYDIGPHVSYGGWVNNGTPPHVIRSHGPWPLRDAYGHAFGRVVHHPGYRGAHFVEAAARDIDGRRVIL